MNHSMPASLPNQYKRYLANRSFIIATLSAFLYFAVSLFINYHAVWYASLRAGNPTTDFLLQHVPRMNTDLIFSEGSLLFMLVVAVLLLIELKTIPFVIKSIALFVCVRSLFVMMTHLGPFPDHITTDLERFRYISSGADLFFSGHTGLPFLMALIFWDRRPLRWIFLVSSILAAIAALLGHLHYTIDIFSAFFITYGIYHIAQRAFPEDYQLFRLGLPK